MTCLCVANHRRHTQIPRIVNSSFRSLCSPPPRRLVCDVIHAWLRAPRTHPLREIIRQRSRFCPPQPNPTAASTANDLLFTNICVKLNTCCGIFYHAVHVYCTNIVHTKRRWLGDGARRRRVDKLCEMYFIAKQVFCERENDCVLLTLSAVYNWDAGVNR